MTRQQTYILAPNFRIKAGSNVISLGNIVADPLRAHRPLTTVEDNYLATNYPRVEMVSEYERNITRSQSSGISAAVWSQFVQTMSAKVSGTRGTNCESKYSMNVLETRYFATDPELEEIESRIKAPRVEAIINSGWLPRQRRPVYMVTGIMIAKGLSASIQRGKQNSYEVEVGGNVPAAGVDLGIQGGRSHSVGDSDSWTAGEDVVFAYQLLKIKVKGWKGNRVKYDELRHQGALLGIEDDDEDVAEDVDHTEGAVSICRAGLVELQESDSAAELIVSRREAGEIAVECICAAENVLPGLTLSNTGYAQTDS